jgi:hypothetical protein
MLSTSQMRSYIVVLGAFLISSCSSSDLQSPTAPVEALAVQAASTALKGPGLIGGLTAAAGLTVKAVWWSKPHKTAFSVSQTIDASGGTISMPETGLTISFPAGAVSAPITITVTSDDKYVAYKMQPSGTKFLKDVTVTQPLDGTSVSGVPLKADLYGAYIADDNARLDGIVKALEIEPSTTIFSLINPRLPQAEVWIIRHFSRYMLSSG